MKNKLYVDALSPYVYVSRGFFTYKLNALERKYV